MVKEKQQDIDSHNSAPKSQGLAIDEICLEEVKDLGKPI